MSINSKKLVRGIGQLAFLLLFMPHSAHAEMRVWVDRSGKQYVAEFSKEIFGKVFLRDVAGEIISMEVESLSASDAEYVRTMKPPKIDVKVTAKTKGIKLSEYNNNLEQAWTVTETIQIRKISNPRFDGRLSGEVYLVGKDIVSGRYVMLCREQFSPVFNEENNGNYEYKVSTEVRRFEDYNLQTRGYEYAGHLVIVFGPQGDRLATGTSLNRFSDEALDSLRKFPYFTFFDQDGRKQSTPHPEYSSSRRSF
jgi:hypothetical protein